VQGPRGALFRCATAEWATPGTAVVVSVRPEKLLPATTGSAPNAISARLARRTYLGHLVHYHLDIGDGIELVMQRQNDPGDPALQWEPGQEVCIAFDDSTAMVFPDEERNVETEEESVTAGISAR
jgi:ABC-type Fe3+/spermidine/putrescine transport system ATPase subunit